MTLPLITGISFLAPAILGPAAAVALAPIAIHLLNKMRVKIVHWGAMKFLIESIRKNQRRLRIEDLLLLLLRCLLILLLAFAFARPVINPEGAGAASSGGPTIAILLMDQTASMGQSNGVSTRFETAKASATKLLNELPSNSQAALYFVTDRVNMAIPRPTSNLPFVRRLLESAEPEYRTGDLLPGIRLALDTLKPFSGTRKEIDIFTDNQILAWKQIDQIKPLLADAPDVNVRLIPLGGAGEENLAVTALKPQASVPAAGQVYDVVAEVTNYSPAPVTGVRVTLALDDQPSADEGVLDTIPPGQARGVRLSVKFPQAGYHTLTATIPPDRLPADNQRSLAVQVIDQMKAAIVEGTPARRDFRDGLFLYNVLAPVASTHAADYFLRPELVAASWLEDGDFSKYEMIFMTNISSVSSNAAQKLQKYVADGGALVIFPGPNTRPDDFNAALKDILPATLAPLRNLTKTTKFVSWQVSKYPHQITALWNDANYTSLGSVRTWIYNPLVITEAKDKAEATLPIVNYQDGTPAVVERPLGRGHVILFSSTADTRWNYFPIHPDFLPFMDRLVGFVSRHESPEKLAVPPGSAFEHVVNADMVGREYSVIRPDSKGKPVIGGKVELVNREAMVRYRDTDMAGAYRVVMKGSDLPIAAFAVQMDPHESDLRAISDDALAFLGKGQGNVVSTQTLDTKPTGGVRREFWGLLVMVAAIIAVVEMMLAHKFSLAK